MMEKRFLLASHNKGKLDELRTILSRLGVETIGLEDAGLNVHVEETGKTFRENALLKGIAACRASGLPSIADDSGLCVDALNGGPGVYSARYGGADLDDAGRCALLLENMRGGHSRTAHFFCTIACVFPDGNVIITEGRCDGMIAYAPMGIGGFGYDPVFFLPERGKTFAQLTAREKNEVSHRAKALREFAEKLEAHLAKQAADAAG